MPVAWLNLMFGGAITLCAGISTAALVQLRSVRRLPPLSRSDSDVRGGEKPLCSVVIAARDEEKRIEATIRHLLAQRGVDIEIVVVDDRSTDQTPAVLKRMAADDGRLRIITVQELPSGWLGKCHACHLGAEAARGEWILFTDADCWLKDDVIARALTAARDMDADHVTITPSNSSPGTAVRAWHLGFLISLLAWMAGANRDRPRSYIGIGAFNLVRASAYRSCGGYEALRLTVVDDVKLGLLLRRVGKRSRAFFGGNDVECHWGERVRDLVHVMEKNYFAAIDYRLWQATSGAFFAFAMLGLFLYGALSGTVLGVAAAASPFFGVAPACVLARRLGWSCLPAFLAPAMFPVFLYALLRSTFLTLRNDGVRWRDTHYPLAQLRAGNVR